MAVLCLGTSARRRRMQISGEGMTARQLGGLAVEVKFPYRAVVGVNNAVALPPSIPLPPPIAITLSCPLAIALARPFNVRTEWVG